MDISGSNTRSVARRRPRMRPYRGPELLAHWVASERTWNRRGGGDVVIGSHALPALAVSLLDRLAQP